MLTIEEKFQELMSGSYKHRNLSRTQEQELRIIYFAAHAHMFDKVSKLNSLPETQIAAAIDALESEIEEFLIKNRRPGGVVKSGAVKEPASSIAAGSPHDMIQRC